MGQMKHRKYLKLALTRDKNKLYIDLISWRQTNVKRRVFNEREATSFQSPTVAPPSALGKPSIMNRQTEYHEALPSSVNVQSHLTSSLDDRWWVPHDCDAFVRLNVNVQFVFLLNTS